MKLEREFKVEKETKNTIRYTETPADGQPPVIGTVYVQKWAMAEGTPQKVKLTLEADK